jgi:hypothetical protein
VRYFGNEAKGDLNSDGIPDRVFLLTQETDGSGTFFYLVGAIQTPATTYNGTHAVLIGDRIAPQTTEFRDGLVVVDYADRAPGEPFTTPPSIGKSLYLKYDPERMDFGEVVQDFEGESHIDASQQPVSSPQSHQLPPQGHPAAISGPAQKSACPEPFIFALPIDIKKATSVLYPGQIRAGDFKAHGGFRFDTSAPGEITVVAPIDAPVVTGARYPVNGEIQYTLELEHPCGVRYRLGHLLTLAPKFQAIAEKFPLPTTLDSRTTQVSPPIEVKKGEVIATAVGLTGTGAGGTGQANTFLDWGVYDYRRKNEASQDPVWAASHTSDTYQHGVCWFDWLSGEDRAKVLALPSSDGEHGTQSDFCK